MAGGVLAHLEGEEEVFSSIKGVVASLAEKLGVKFVFRENFSDEPYCHARASLQILCNKESVGFLGILHPQCRQNIDFKKNSVGFWQLNLSRLLPYVKNDKKFQPLPKFPSINLDLSILVPENIAWKTVCELAKAVSPDLITAIDLIDVYKNGKIEAGKKSITVRITYQAADRTLEMAQVEKLQQSIIAQLQKGVLATIR